MPGTNQAMDLNSLKARQFIDGQKGISLISAETKHLVKNKPAQPKDNKDAATKVQKELQVTHKLNYEFDSLDTLCEFKMFDITNKEGSSSGSGAINMDMKASEDKQTIRRESEITGPMMTGLPAGDKFDDARKSLIVQFSQPYRRKQC